ncbi:hypothetical protein B484DRAFT_458639 [Ochromonadaceae sp. CCMP2298]|nr:hypothetical protein B484DRAFT_458639 [Ochromonadaceae sp. CCMP2298]
MTTTMTLFSSLVTLSTVLATVAGDGWTADTGYLNSTDGRCDFPIIYSFGGHSGLVLPTDVPFIVRNIVPDWPANHRWQKESFKERYGSRPVRTGSESSIVYSGGVAEDQSATLEMLIERMSNQTKGIGSLTSSFVFDTTILKAVPELVHDMTVPFFVTSWDNAEQEEKRDMWHMLSMGPSKSGLPYHNHGRTWLAVVHGAKQWFVYPPGYDAPFEVDSTVNLLYPISDWVRDVYPRLLSYPKPPLDSKDPPTGGGYRPLECEQVAGDVFFLPSRWVHQTVNKGETIAIGGQETIYDNDRYSMAAKVLEKNDKNYEALKDVGLSQMNRAGANLKYLQGEVDHRHGEPLIRLEGASGLEELMRRSGDTWVVLYYDSLDLFPDHLEALVAAWTHLAHSVTEANVAMVDVAECEDETTLDVDFVGSQPDHIRVSTLCDGFSARVAGGYRFESLPQARLHGPNTSSNTSSNTTSVEPDFEGTVYEGDYMGADMDAQVRAAMGARHLPKGSIYTTPVAVQRQYGEAVATLR